MNAPWLSSLRLRTLPLALSGIVLGSCWGGCPRPGVFAWALACATCLQILSNLANELGDFRKGADNACRLGPHRALQSGRISQKGLQGLMGLFGVLAGVSGLVLLLCAFGSWRDPRFWSFVGLGLACGVAALCYTLGKRPYGYRGLGDLFVFLFFGLVAVLGSRYLQGRRPDLEGLLLAGLQGLLSVAVLNVNNMRDRAGDLRSGKHTLAVRLGPAWAKKYHSALLVGALCCAYAVAGPWALVIVPLYAYHLYVIFCRPASSYDGQMPLLTLSTLAYVLFLVGHCFCAAQIF